MPTGDLDQFLALDEADIDGIASRRDDLHLLAEQSSQHADTPVRGAEVLVGMEGDLALASLRLPVTGEPLGLLERRVAVVLRCAVARRALLERAVLLLEVVVVLVVFSAISVRNPSP